MSFSGSGAGTVGNPFQITNANQFEEMNGYVPNPVFDGVGLNDCNTSYNYKYTGNGPCVFTIAVNGINGIKTSTLNAGGSGYAVNDLFTVDGGTAGLLATGKVLSVNAGAVVTYSILTYGSGYSIANGIDTTATTGGGIGLKINITALQYDTFKWKKDEGSWTTVIMTMGDQLLSDSVRIKFDARIGHTVDDEWTVTIALDYWLLMNDIDFVDKTTFNILTFNGHLDGDGYEVINIKTSTISFGLKDGSSIANITFRYTRVGLEANVDPMFTYQNRTLANVSITNIHILATDGAAISYISNDDWAATCTINNIVAEGEIRAVFPGSIYGLVEHIKVYRNYNCIAEGVNAGLVGSLENGAEMRYCQHIVPIASASAGNNAYLVNYMAQNTLIKECFVLANADVIYTGTTQTTHGLVHRAYDSTSVIQDCYFKGNLAVNKGELLGVKSGYTIMGFNGATINRCFSWGNVNTPENDNRTPLNKTGSSNVNDNYYNETEIIDITPVDVADRQTGLTTAEFLVAGNFTDWDFDAIWEMGDENPELQNNPLYAFELDLRLLTLISTTRNAADEITILVDTAWEFDTFGVEVSLNNVIIYDEENTFSNIVPVSDTEDNLYVIKLYWLDGGIKTYVYETEYFHYCQDSAVDVTTVEVINKVTLTDAFYVHGSCIYGDYIYGSTRGRPFPEEPGCIVKAPLSNINNFITIPIYSESEGVGQATDMEQLVECGGYLWAQFNNNLLLQFNPATDEYKVFELSITTLKVPILTDGEYLYIIGLESTQKVDPDEFIGEYPKWNPDFVYDVIATYDHSSQGGHIEGEYDFRVKGYVHSAVADNNYIYLAFTTTAGYGTDISGYNEGLGISVHELHKVDKSTMLPVDWIYIPKCTDDMCQTLNYLFLGVELQPTANPVTLGYQWGVVGIRKSDLNMTYTPRLHSLDDPPNNQSYASLIFGNYLLDSRTNQYVAIIDITDVDDWLFTEPIGKRTLKFYGFTSGGVGLGGIPNEWLLSTSGYFYSFLWTLIYPPTVPSKLIQTDLPGLNFFAVPSVETISSVVVNNSVTLTGYLLSNGGKVITSRGFRYGTDPDDLNLSVESSDITSTFTAQIPFIAEGTWYYQAYAINGEGESSAEILSFVIITSIHAQPPVVSFAGNPMEFDFEITNYGEDFIGMHYKLKVYNEDTALYEEVAIEKRVTPDADHHCKIDISTILRWNPEKAFTFPGDVPTLITKRNDLRKKYYLVYSEKFGIPLQEQNIQETDPQYVLSGGLSKLIQSKYNQDASSWWAEKLIESPKKFLSRSLVKSTDIAASERLYFIFPEDKAEIYLNIKVYYEDFPNGISSIYKKIIDAEIYDIYEIDASFTSLGLGFRDDSSFGRVLKYDVWLSDGTSDYSEVKTFVPDDVYNKNVQHFMFNNSFGVPEGISFKGILTGKAGYNSDIADFILEADDVPSDAARNYLEILEHRLFILNSGWITAEEIHFLREFLASKRKYWMLKSLSIPIIVKDSEILTKESEEHLYQVEIEFAPSLEDEFPSDDLTPEELEEADYGVGSELTILDPSRFVNETYQTFTPDGEEMDFVAAAAIESTARTKELTTVLPGDILVFIYTLEMTSGQLPKMAVYDDDYSWDPLSDEKELSAGTGYVLIAVPYIVDYYALVDCYVRIKNTDSSSFTLSNCSLKKVNTEFLKQIYHENNA